MTKSEFRQKYAEIIEEYQLIEFNLRSICALSIFNSNKEILLDRLSKYESDMIWELIKHIKDVQVQRQITLLSQDDFDALDVLRKNRNYWVHQCFADEYNPVVFDIKGELRKAEFGKKLEYDLQEVINWNEKLGEVVRSNEKPDIIDF